MPREDLGVTAAATKVLVHHLDANAVEYDLVLVLLGIIGISAALLPRLLKDKALSYPIVYVVAGIGLGFLPLQVGFHPLDHPYITERLTELGVILALMGSGLKLERVVGWRRWGSTWRLLAIAMPLTIVVTGLLGFWAGLPLAAAVLVGAVLAPTDPVLASDVQVPAPGKDTKDREEKEIRFALTSEAGLNDGLAFPFTHLALAVLAAGALTGPWLVDWVLKDVLYRVGVGIAMGLLMGRLLALAIFVIPGHLSRSSQGFVVIAMTLLAYGATELLNAYGFIAVFVAALAFRGWERKHKFHRALHDTSEQAERSILAVLLVLFGAAIASGLLAALTWQAGLAAAAVIFIVRPLAGGLSLLGSPLGWPERAAISFFGIRGIGSFYYLSFAINRGDFPAAEAVWAFVGAVVFLSIFLHGITVRPVMGRIREGD